MLQGGVRVFRRRGVREVFVVVAAAAAAVAFYYRAVRVGRAEPRQFVAAHRQTRTPRRAARKRRPSLTVTAAAKDERPSARKPRHRTTTRTRI